MSGKVVSTRKICEFSRNYSLDSIVHSQTRHNTLLLLKILFLSIRACLQNADGHKTQL